MPATDVIQSVTAAIRVPLTKREHAVLELIAFGLGNKEIGRRLAMGRRTVETHVEHLLRKLDVPTRSRAVSEALRLGLLAATAATASTSLRKSTPNNLPFQLTTLLGRQQELTDLKSSLESKRLITLSGAGGVGKTRLALRIGVDLLDAFPDGVWFCDFSPISNAELIGSVIANVVGVHQHGNQPLLDSIVRALKHKRVLLIFDNCEHVVNVVADFADEILHKCPNVRILATSRQSLGIMGEVVSRLPSLAVPESADSLRPDTAARYSAVALFLDRAQALNTGFHLGKDNVSAVARICRRLDGIPLAIELAATRVKAVSVHSLAESLHNRFAVLTSGNRTALPRHQTLRALLDWSYNLLTPQEQQLFNRTGVFAGSFSLNAVATVCRDDRVNEHDVPDLMSSLIDKSLVVADTSTEIERYRLLESPRAYAIERLVATTQFEQLSRKHAEYFRDLATGSDSSWGIGSTAASLARMELELDNYRATLEWALTRKCDIDLGIAVASALQRLWLEGALAVEGRYWISEAQRLLNESSQPQLAARLWRAAAMLAYGKRKRDCAQRALELYEKVHDEHGVGRALLALTFGLIQMGRFEDATRANARAFDLMQKCGDRYGVATSLSWSAVLSRHSSAKADKRELFMRALDAAKSLGDEIGTANVLNNFSEMEFADGHAQRAVELVTEAIETHKHGRSSTSFPIAYCNMGAYYIGLSKLDKACEALREALHFARHREDIAQVAGALQHFALIGALRGETERSARLFGYANLQFEQLQSERDCTEQWGYDKLIGVLRTTLSDSEIGDLAAQSAEWSEDRAVEEALSI